MNTPRKRRIWPYVLGGLIGLCMLPVIFVASHLGLSSDARVIRDELKAASGSNWTTRVQFRSGFVLIPTARIGMALFNGPMEARAALGAVNSACVGVYERSGDDSSAKDFSVILEDMDSRMKRAGWERTIAVSEGRENVVVYSKAKGWGGESISVCIGVLNGDELVVVSADVAPGRLMPLIAEHLPKNAALKKST